MLDRQRRAWAIWARLSTALDRVLQRVGGSPVRAGAAGQAPPAPRVGGAAPEATPSPAEQPDESPLRVLVVEDDKVNQLVVMGMLRQMAHRGDCVADGIEALEALTRGSYDVVLMDIRMPNMDGIEATQRIRHQTGPVARIPIVALTANATTEERLRCAEAGMNDFISKPFRRAELETMLQKWRPSTSDSRGHDRQSPGHPAPPH